MKLVSIAITNFLKLGAVEITPHGAVVPISGANGAGKSSVIRALEAALGGKGAVPADPVKHGADESRIVADFGDLIVRLVIKPDRTTQLVVTNAEGFKATSPQKLLEGLFGKLLDPVAFSRMEPKQQRAQLASMVGLSAMLDELAVADRVDFENRTAVNRDLAKAKAQLDAMPVVEACEPVDVSATLAQLKAAQAEHAAALATTRRCAAMQETAVARRETALTKRAQAETLLNEADALDEAAVQLDTDARALMDTLVPPVDLTPLELAIQNADAINAQVRAYAAREAAAAHVATLAEMSANLTGALQQREAERAAVIQAAPLPIPGLGFGEDCITYDGVPFDQASTAEQLRVSAAIAMALQPKLRVLVIREGSLLDAASLAMLTEMAEAQDFVCLCEMVDTSGEVGIYIEDGSVVAIDGVPVEVAAA